jgi:hypothetical protein
MLWRPASPSLAIAAGQDHAPDGIKAPFLSLQLWDFAPCFLPRSFLDCRLAPCENCGAIKMNVFWRWWLYGCGR